jgi:hypothetical protein
MFMCMYIYTLKGKINNKLYCKQSQFLLIFSRPNISVLDSWYFCTDPDSRTLTKIIFMFIPF